MTITNGTVSETEPAHALLSASSADRWLTCTPSARLEETMPDVSSIYAREGTAAHAFAELRLKYLLKQIPSTTYRERYEATKTEHADAIEEWEHTDWDAINSYTEYVMAEVKRLGGVAYIEKRVDFSRYAQEGFGTSDVLIYAPKEKTIKSIDLKFGKGVPVSAVDNSQAKLYALGGLLEYSGGAQIETVEWAIVQPRVDYIGEDSMSASDLVRWAEEVVMPAAKLAWEGEGTLTPSDKACRFCKVAPTCRARVAENVLIARRDFMKDPEESLMSMEEVARILPDLDGWIAWATKLKTYALEQVRDHNATIPGYKLVRGRSNRAWGAKVDIIAKQLIEAGVSETDIYSEPSVRSVAQMEKQVGKRVYTEKVEALVVKPLGAPALVPESDPRPGVDAAAEARVAFAIDENPEKKETK